MRQSADVGSAGGVCREHHACGPAAGSQLHESGKGETSVQTILRGLLTLALLVVGCASAFAQLDVGDSGLNACSQIDGLSKAGNYSAAHAKAQACLQALDQKLQGEVGKLFPQAVAGWTRGALEQNTVAGFNNITNHKNPTSVNSYAESVNFLRFYGGDKRRFVVRVRVLGKE